MIKIFLCDDNEVLLAKYYELIGQIAVKNKIEVSIESFVSGEQLLFRLEENENSVDIIYLDIIMGGVDGIAVAKTLREKGCRAEIVFLTSNREHVFESFDMNPLHYILKDSVQDSKFEEIFLKAVEFTSNRSKRVFVCECGSVRKQIELRKISYFEVQNRTITAHYDGKIFTFYSTMEKLESDLADSNFIRCHRSFIVNLNDIDEIGKTDITLMAGEIIPVSATHLKRVKLAFSSYLSDFFNH